MTQRGASIGRDLWWSGIAAGVIAMALTLAGASMWVAALVGFAVGLALYFALSFVAARKR
jgi:hypothetical protein